MDRLVKSVVARWNLKVAMEGWNPPIPQWVFARVAFAPSGDKIIFTMAKDSVNTLLPNLLALFRKSLGDKYSVNVSQRGQQAYYYFTTPSPYPLESIAMYIGVSGEIPMLSMSFTPYTLEGKPDFSKTIEMKEKIADPEVVGLHMMSMARRLISKATKRMGS